MEAAGLVLGAIPLVLGTLRYYEKSMKICERYKNHYWEFKQVRTSLLVETFRFKDSCTKILTQSFQNDEVKKMLDEPDGSMWKDPDNVDRLRRQLGDAYEIFIVKSEEVRSTIEKYQWKLGAHKIERTASQTPKFFREQYRRLKFSLSSDGYEDLLARLRQSNSDLGFLTSPAVISAPCSAKDFYPASYVIGVRESIKSTYTALKSHWQCPCQRHHKVKFQLGRFDAEPGSSIRSYTQHVSQPCFHIIFSYGQVNHSGTAAVPWDWADLKISSTVHDSLPPPAMVQSTSCNGNARMSVGQSGHHRKRRKVHFTNATNTGGSSNAGTTSILFPEQQVSLNGYRIVCICKALSQRKRCQSTTDLGYIVDHSAKRKHCFLPLKQEARCVSNFPSECSLSEAFSNPRCRQKLLPLILRLRLASILSMSFLEFGQTPWTNVGWSKKDILFIERDGQLSYEEMFVSESMVADTDALLSQPSPTCPVRNRTLFALGILLIELCFGQSLEAICNENKVPLIVQIDGSPKSLPDYPYGDIKTILNSVGAELGSIYKSVVRRCLKCTFDCDEADFNHDDFRKAVYSGVVLPLEDMVKALSLDTA